MIAMSPPLTLTGKYSTCSESRGLRTPVDAQLGKNWPIFPNLLFFVDHTFKKPYRFAAMQFQASQFDSILLKLLRPLARIFLHFGVSYREFCELSKAAFVGVASEDYGVHGRPTNASRIAAMTGLTRKEISRIRGKLESGEGAQTERRSPINEVLSAWCSADEFVDARGRPRRLPLKGERASFESLIAQYAGDIPEGAMRKELLRIDAIELADNKVRILPDGLAKLAADKQKATELLLEPYKQLQAAARKVSR